MKDLSIIIVNWNSLAFAESCIESIEENLRGLSYEVIVVDNASGDAPCGRLATRFPWIKLLLSSENIGFGRANNLGAEHADGEVLLFLNPDTRVEGDAVQIMFDELTSRLDAGVAGCRLLNRDRTLQLSSVQAFPTILNQLLSLERLQRLWPQSPLWGKQALYLQQANAVCAVDVVSGAALMIKRPVFATSGGFNPLYFMYAEEVDLCAAVRRLGLKVLHCTRAQIVHFGSESTRQCEEGFADIEMRESVYKLLRSIRGRWYAALFRKSLLLSAVGRLAVLIPFRMYIQITADERRKRKAKKSWSKWVRILVWTISSRADQNVKKTAQPPEKAKPLIHKLRDASTVE